MEMKSDQIKQFDCLDKVRGVLFGTALGDALGFPCENLSAKRINQIFGRVESYRILGDLGYGTDDTEQTALLATALLRSGGESTHCVKSFKRSLAGWFLRLPFSTGQATLTACLKILLFIPESGVRSAGNGSAMRASILGIVYCDDKERQQALGTAISRVTHTDERAIEGALFCSSFAASLCRFGNDTKIDAIRENCRGLVEEIQNQELKVALKTAMALAEGQATKETAVKQLKTTGYVIHTLSFALFCVLRYGEDPFEAIVEAVNAGGDTDSIGAITGAWIGAWHGASRLPQGLIAKLNNGPFGREHLEKLAQNLASQMQGRTYEIPQYNWIYAMLRNILFIPVILAHVLRRIAPF